MFENQGSELCLRSFQTPTALGFESRNGIDEKLDALLPLHGTKIDSNEIKFVRIQSPRRPEIGIPSSSEESFQPLGSFVSDSDQPHW